MQDFLTFHKGLYYSSRVRLAFRTKLVMKLMNIKIHTEL